MALLPRPQVGTGHQAFLGFTRHLGAMQWPMGADIGLGAHP